MTSLDSLDELQRALDLEPDNTTLILELGRLSERSGWTSEQGLSLDETFRRLFGQDSDYLGELPKTARDYVDLGRRGIAYLLKAVDTEWWIVGRWYALNLLVELADPVTAPLITQHLLPHLEHPHKLFQRMVRHTLTGLIPGALGPLVEALESNATPSPALLDAIAFLGPSAQPLIPALEALELSTENILATRQALGGPWPSEPNKPVPYQGEQLRFELEIEPTEAPFVPSMPTWNDALFYASEHISALLRNLDDGFYEGLSSDVIHEVDTPWPPEANAAIAAFEAWHPNTLVLAQPRVRLTYFRWDSHEVEGQDVEAEHPEMGFTQIELLHKALQIYGRYAGGHDRIFEGIQRRADGAYDICSGY